MRNPYVFSQLVGFLDRNHFNYLVRKYNGDRYVKTFTCWNQLLTLMFGQLSNRQSMRDLIAALEAHQSKCYHLGVSKRVTRSNLAKANEERDNRIFEDFAFYMMAEARKLSKRLYRIHSYGSFFVVRAKKNLKYKTVKWVRRLSKNILSDAQLELTDYYPSKHYPETLRLVKYWDEENQREFTYLTNAKHLTAQQIADLYKSRWQVELFFKWLKQHLRIKRFWGTSENAVCIQVYVAITTFCMVAIMQHKMKLSRSTYEILQILNLSLTDTTPLVELLNKLTFKMSKINIVLVNYYYFKVILIVQIFSGH